MVLFILHPSTFEPSQDLFGFRVLVRILRTFQIFPSLALSRIPRTSARQTINRQ